jgi:hypothetical protein
VGFNWEEIGWITGWMVMLLRYNAISGQDLLSWCDKLIQAATGSILTGIGNYRVPISRIESSGFDFT